MFICKMGISGAIPLNPIHLEIGYTDLSTIITGYSMGKFIDVIPQFPARNLQLVLRYLSGH